MIAAQVLRLRAQLVTSRPDLYPPIPGLQLNTSYAEVELAASGAQPTAQAARPQLARAAGVIVAVGSHDMTLDLLGDSLHARNPAITLVSAHVGSLQGLLALQRNEAHLAGSHLFSPQTGQYNVDYVQRILTDRGVVAVIVGFVRRMQGLIVARGNPLGIAGVADLARLDVRFVNRQPGAGTRVLLDYELGRAGIAPAHIHGYGQVVASHMSVAATSRAGPPTVGWASKPRRARNLDFVPLTEERYDLVIPRVHYESPLLAPPLVATPARSGFSGASRRAPAGTAQRVWARSWQDRRDYA
ncbi:MAG: substrate-binding domain-containing protein [Caldilineaceae bacterium]